MNLKDIDQKLIWHPFTQHKTAEPSIVVKSAKGLFLYDENDKKYMDLMSSWWVNLHGHSNIHIAKAIAKQAKTLEHVMFAGITHEPAIELCSALQNILPKSLSKFFFSDNGSTSIEAAVKIAYQYWSNQGLKEKRIFLNFEGGYHGDTIGAMSAGNSDLHDQFSDLFFSSLTIPFPEKWDLDDEIETKESIALEALKSHLKQYGGKIAALILEPLMQGASGMRMCRPSFVNRVVQIVREHDILVIFDEVMTGFGRTGTNFALDQLDIAPDFLCISKGLTGGFLPLALTITTEKIYNAFLSNDYARAFLHGHTYCANPIGCAAAIASLKLLLDTKTQKQIENINKTHAQCTEDLYKQNLIEKVRILGTIAAFDIKSAQNTSAPKLRLLFKEEGLIIRPLGKTIYLIPPYVIKSHELKEAYARIQKILEII